MVNFKRWLSTALLTALACAPAYPADQAKPGAASRDDIERKLEEAQRRLDAAAREVADLSMSLSERIAPHVTSLPRVGGERAMLGINLGPRGEGETDEGVRIFSVSPGGAAAEAGLKSGDVLLEINGQTLKRSGDESPRQKLLAAMREVKAGDKVSLRYRREGKVSTASVVAQDATDRLFSRALPLHGPDPLMPLPQIAFLRAEGVFGSAELAPLTPKLGQYFGAEKGLLVVRAPADSRLKLEDGDVILDIDGRTPTSASHAFRILTSYESGETVKLNVLRARKRMTIDVTIPENEWAAPLGWAPRPAVRVFPAVEAAMPAPPAPPAAPGRELEAPI